MDNKYKMMTEEAEYDQSEELENPQYQELKSKLSTYYGSNNKELKILLIACEYFESYQKIDQLFNTKTLRLQKKVAEIKSAIEKYFEDRNKKENSCPVQGKQPDYQSIRESLLDGCKSELERLQIQSRPIENHLYIETFLDELKQFATEAVRTQHTKQRKKNLSSKKILEKGVIELLACFISYQEYKYQIQQAAIKISQTLSIDAALNEGELKGVFNNKKDRIITIIQNFKSYNILDDYGGHEIYDLKDQFQQEFVEISSKENIPILILKEILEELLKDPYYNWTNRKDLSENQMIALIKSNWLQEDSKLRQLMQIYKIKDKLDYKLNKEIESIMNYITSSCNINLNTEDIDNLKGYLKDFDLISFLDQNRSINASMTIIYDFMIKKCPNYMNAQRSQEKCVVEMRIAKLLQLKSKLFQIVDHFSLKKWKHIQDEVMKGNLDVIEECIHDKKVKYNFRQWVYSNMKLYFEVISKQKTIKSLAQAEVMDFLVKKDIRNLKFKEIIDLKNDIMEYPYYEVIETTPVLALNEIKQLKPEFLKLPNLNQYRMLKKIELSDLKNMAKIKIKEAVSLIEYQQITYELVDKFINDYLQNPKSSTIYEQKGGSDYYKKIFLNVVSQIPQIKNYIKQFDLRACISRQANYMDKLQAIIPEIYLQSVKPYIFIYGEIPISNDEYCKIKLNNQRHKQIERLLNRLDLEKRKNLKNIQSSKEFKEFVEQLPIIAKFYKRQCEDKFLLLAKKIIGSRNSFMREQQQMLINLVRGGTKQGYRNILKDSKFEESRFKCIKVALQSEQIYKILDQLQESLKENQKFFLQLKFNKKIRSAQHHQLLMGLTKKDKVQLLEQLQRGYKNQIIKKHTQLTDQSKNQLITFIESSEEFKDYYNNSGKSRLESSKIIETTETIEKIQKLEKLEKIDTTQIKPINPEKTQELENAPVVSHEQYVEIEVFEEIPESKDQSQLNPVPQKPLMNKDEFLRKLDKLMLDFKERSQYKNARNEFQQNPLVLVEHIVKKYPLNEEKMSFWTAGKGFMKKGLITEFHTLIQKTPGLKQEIELYQQLS